MLPYKSLRLTIRRRCLVKSSKRRLNVESLPAVPHQTVRHYMAPQIAVEAYQNQAPSKQKKRKKATPGPKVSKH